MQKQSNLLKNDLITRLPVKKPSSKYPCCSGGILYSISPFSLFTPSIELQRPTQINDFTGHESYVETFRKDPHPKQTGHAKGINDASYIQDPHHLSSLRQ